MRLLVVFIICFQEYIEGVGNTIPASRLLIFRVKDGWRPLCEFLDRPRPAGDFPFINDEAATKDILNKIINEGFEAIFGYSMEETEAALRN